jgi:hypothetical protein
MKKTNQRSDENELFVANDLLDIKLSYSRLSDYDQNGPKTLVKRSDVKGEGVDMGGLIDVLLFTPEELNDKYYIFDGSKPTATLEKLTNIILENYSKIPSTGVVLEIVRANKFWDNIVKEQTLKNKFDNEEFWGYLKSAYESKDKKVITTEQKLQAEEVVDVLKSHEYSKEIVAFPEEHESKYAQYSLEFQYKNVVFRGILDLLVVNHKDKTIRIIDLKTGAKSASEFSNSFVKFRYYLQEAVYQAGIEKIKKDLKLEGYEVLPFQFLYISRYEKIPLLYTVSQKWHDAALKGFYTQSGYKYRGLDEIIDDISWHWKNQKFDFSREIYEQNGSLTLNDDFITIDE